MVSMRSLFAYFWRDEPRVIAFVACCCAVLLLAYWKRDALAVQFKNRLVLPALALLLVFGNPASAHILVTRAVETQSLRFFWLIPVSFLLAAAVVAVIGRLPRRWLRAAAALAAVPVLVLCTHQLKTLRTNWQYATPNWQKTPQVVLDLCDAIMADDRYDDKRAAFTFPLDLWVRQYQPDIFLLFSWTGGENLDLRREMDPGDGRLVERTGRRRRLLLPGAAAGRQLHRQPGSPRIRDALRRGGHAPGHRDRLRQDIPALPPGGRSRRC